MITAKAGDLPFCSFLVLKEIILLLWAAFWLAGNTLQIPTLLRLLVTSPVAPRCRVFLAGLENFLSSASHQRHGGGFTSADEPRLQATRMGRSRAGCREPFGGGSCLPQLPAGAVAVMVTVMVTVTAWASAPSRLLKGQGGNVRQSWPGLS